MAGLFHTRRIGNEAFPFGGRASRSGMRIPPFDDLRWPTNAFLRSIPYTVVKFGVSAWRFLWTETTGPYDIYLEGSLIDSVPLAEYEADLLDFVLFPPPLEIIDANGNRDLIDSHLFPPFAQIQWYGDPSSTNYYVEEKTGSASFTRRQIVNDNDLGYHVFRTATLLKGINEWRVIPVDISENEGTPVGFIFNIVPPPLPPETVPIVYNESAGEIVVGP